MGIITEIFFFGFALFMLFGCTQPDRNWDNDKHELEESDSCCIGRILLFAFAILGILMHRYVLSYGFVVIAVFVSLIDMTMLFMNGRYLKTFSMFHNPCVMFIIAKICMNLRSLNIPYYVYDFYYHEFEGNSYYSDSANIFIQIVIHFGLWGFLSVKYILERNQKYDREGRVMWVH